MINASQMTLRRGPRALLENVSFTLHSGWHVGIVGRNGTGKSTLFATMLGELQPDKGDLTVPKHLAVASVAQETPSLPDLAMEFVLDGDAELRELEKRLERAEESGDVEKICNIHERLNQIGGYAARARAAKLLDGLGFSPEAQAQPVASFSGGWRMRLNLAKALMCRSDLLLLDEPTNHLDLDTVLWLQAWLVDYPGTLLIISHDREFLDAVTTHTLHLENSSANLYTGNYSQFERMRAERMTLQSLAFSRQQREIAHLQKFIDRFRASATKATQAQSRIKALERMERVAAVHADSEFEFEFPVPERLPSPLIRLDDVNCGYGEKVILRKVRLLIAPGERIGLLGPNGAGKSTLVQTLAGAIAPLGGNMLRDSYLKVGYFAQHTTDRLDPEASPMLHMKRLDPQAGEQALRNFLGGFNFRGDRAFEAVAPFSGGEKARLALAMVVYQRPNILLLDEPTNHLDLDVRHAIETALLEYPGAVVVVSHDRHLLTSVCDRFYLVAEGRCEVFAGDLDDYAKWLRTRPSPTATQPRSAPASPASQPTTQAPATPTAATPSKSAISIDPQTARALRDTIKKLETKIEKAQKELKVIESALTDESLYQPGNKTLPELLKKQSTAQKALEALEEEWLLTTEKLDA